MKKRIYQRKTATACNRLPKKLVSLALVAAIGGSGVGGGKVYFTTCAQYEMEWEISQMEQELRFGEPTMERQEEILTRLCEMRLDLTIQRTHLPQVGYDYNSQQEIESFYNLEQRVSDLKMWTESSASYERLKKELREEPDRREAIGQLFGSFVIAEANPPQVVPQSQNETLFDLEHFMPETQGQYEDPLFDFWDFMPGPQGFVLPGKLNKERGKK